MYASETFTTSIITRYGDKGRQWLKQLPALIDTCAKKWGLTGIQPFPELTYNYVLFAKQGIADVVLKLRIDIPLFEQEVAYLRYYQGPECVALLDYDNTLGAMLLERIMPGTPLMEFVRQGKDHQATIIGMHLLQKIQKSSEDLSFPDLETLLPRFERNFPELDRYVYNAAFLRDALLSSTKKKVLLHGDFHHGNILADKHGVWCVIDPEGLIGDRLYDVAVFIRNPLTFVNIAADPESYIKERISLCASLLGEEYQRVYDWVYLQTVTSAYWSLEDGLSATKHLKFLAALENITCSY